MLDLGLNKFLFCLTWIISGDRSNEQGASQLPIMRSAMRFFLPIVLTVFLLSTHTAFAQEKADTSNRMNPAIDDLPTDSIHIGFGIKPENEITSSVYRLSEKNFNRGSISDAENLFRGRISGLQVSRPGGNPNGDFTLRLRGLSSLIADTTPLVVIDGVTGISLNTVDPDDIESIDILKDASAAAIYGELGANGVIIITTKKGGIPDSERPVQITYSGQVTTNFIENRTDVLNAEEFRNFTNQLGLGDLDQGSETDWIDEITRNGFTQMHHLAITGGNSQTFYRVSGNFRDVENIQRGTGFDQINGRLNITHRMLDNRLALTGNLSVTDRDEDRGFAEAFRYAGAMNPTIPVRDPASDQFGGFSEPSAFDMFNPVAIQNQTANIAEQQRYVTGLRADYDFSRILDGLSAGISYSHDSSDETRGEFYSKEARFRGFDRNGLAIREDTNHTIDVFESTVKYSNSFSRVRLETVAGYMFREITNENQIIEAGNFLSDVFSFDNLDRVMNQQNVQLSLQNSRFNLTSKAGFGRINLRFDDTWFLSGSFRRAEIKNDDTKVKNYYAISGGTLLSNLFSLRAAEELKVRIGYGRTGNLLFETKEEINTGLDFSFVDNRLKGSVDFYRSDSENLLARVQVPVPPNVFPTQLVNIGSVRNRGIDLTIQYDLVRRQMINWQSGFIFSAFSTTLTSLSNDNLQFGDQQFIAGLGAPGLNDTRIIRVKEGELIGDIWGPEFARFTTAEDGFLDGDGNPLVGGWLFFDKDGNEVRPEDITDEDRTVLGNGLPDFTLGWNNIISFKQWDINMFWRGAFGHQMVNTSAVFQTNPSVIGLRNVTKDALSISELSESPQFSSFYVENADFFRLDNLTIGYTFETGTDSPFRSLRLYGSGNNLLTITNFSGIDPEPQFADSGPTANGGRAGTPDALAPGIERRNAWFTQTSVTLGINIGL